MTIVTNEFRAWCGLPSVHGAINSMHISIIKSSCFKNYYYHKINGYSVMAQVVVDCKKMFINFFVNLLRIANYFKVLHRCIFYKNAQCHGLFEFDTNFEHDFPPYLLEDKCHPLIIWIMNPFKEKRHHIVLELYNGKHKHGCFVVENMFGILNK
jgi:hypothetical protein